MKIIETKVIFHDGRGDIRDVISDTPISTITHMTCEPGSVRGNHWHKATTHYDYILKGSFELYIKTSDGRTEKTIIKAGDVVFSPPGEARAFKALEYSEFLSCTYGPSRNNSEDFYKDTVKLETPLVT
ncbi:cupin domain-containing protein [Candidatus Uhrbacteria bacterium]|nr:cupin domain-containing protein [Candidatus Uhrbacteria bacterium]